MTELMSLIKQVYNCLSIRTGIISKYKRPDLKRHSAFSTMNGHCENGRLILGKYRTGPATDHKRCTNDYVSETASLFLLGKYVCQSCLKV
jgi:hypothetical protein